MYFGRPFGKYLIGYLRTAGPVLLYGRALGDKCVNVTCHPNGGMSSTGNVVDIGYVSSDLFATCLLNVHGIDS